MSMRTAINLDDALLAEAKQVAARTDRSLTAVVEDPLRQRLHRRHPTTRRAIDLTVFGQGGTRPGVDLDDSAACSTSWSSMTRSLTMRLVDVNILISAHRLDAPSDTRTTPLPNGANR
jgi:hypothetical protein